MTDPPEEPDDRASDRVASFAPPLRWWDEAELRLLAANDDLAEAQEAAIAELERRGLK